MVKGLLEIAVDRLRYNCRIEVVTHGHLWAAIKQQKRIQDDLKRVDAELELSTHRIDEFQLDISASVIAKTYKTPPIAVRYLQKKKIYDQWKRTKYASQRKLCFLKFDLPNMKLSNEKRFDRY